jgi:hypothetical protein
LSHIIFISPVVVYGCETWSLILKQEDGLRMFESGVLRKILEAKKDEVTRDWRKFHNEKFCDLYSSSNINKVIRSRRMRWAVHVARMGERRGLHRVLRERALLKDLGVDGNIILEWILKRSDERAWTGLIWLRLRTSDGLL